MTSLPHRREVLAQHFDDRVAVTRGHNSDSEVEAAAAVLSEVLGQDHCGGLLQIAAWPPVTVMAHDCVSGLRVWVRRHRRELEQILALLQDQQVETANAQHAATILRHHDALMRGLDLANVATQELGYIAQADRLQVDPCLVVELRRACFPTLCDVLLTLPGDVVGTTHDVVAVRADCFETLREHAAYAIQERMPQIPAGQRALKVLPHHLRPTLRPVALPGSTEAGSVRTAYLTSSRRIPVIVARIEELRQELFVSARHIYVTTILVPFGERQAMRPVLSGDNWWHYNR